MEYILAIAEMIPAIVLVMTAEYAKKSPSPKWRLLYLLPAAIAIGMMSFIPWDKGMVGLYLAPVLIALSLLSERVGFRRCLIGTAALLILATTVFLSLYPGYRRYDAAGDFETVFHTMKQHYVLAEEKGIDWDVLYEEYKPRFRELDQSWDITANYQLWQEFSQEFYDGHVGYEPTEFRVEQIASAICESYGNDYGLSLVRLSSGAFAAVNVEGCGASYSILDTDETDLHFEKVKTKYQTKQAAEKRLVLSEAGIKNGTIITKWDGKDIEDYYHDIRYYFFQNPVRENEAFYQPMYVAGMGDASVEITFLTDDGQEKTVTAEALGAYAPRLYHTIETLDRGVKMTNLDWREINDDTLLLRIYQMAYDANTYSGADYTEMTDKLREQVLAYRKAGYKNIIFDLRCNSGGSPYMVQGVAQLFAPEGEHVAYYSAKINTDTATYERGADGKYIKDDRMFAFQGEDLWHDGQMILLVNAQTISAGDDMVYMMGAYPNVTVMGLTRSNNSCQAVSDMSISTGRFAFSVVPNLTEDGDVAIDTLTDHKARVPFDTYIPMDQTLICAVFDNGEDYLTEYAAGAFR